MNEPTKETPTHWVIAGLADCVQILDAHRIPINAREREQRINGQDNKKLFPYYGATGQVGMIDDYIFEGESALLGEDGAPFFDRNKAKAYVVSGKYWVNNHAHILRGVAGHMDNTFLCHFLNQIDYSGYITGTTRAKLTQNDLRRIIISIPPYSEQQRIASKIEELFSELDAGVASLKRARALLKKYRQAVLKAAVTGELTRDWRERRRGQIEETGADLLRRLLKARREAREAAELKKLRAKGKPPKDQPILSEEDLWGLPALPDGWIWGAAGQPHQRRPNQRLFAEKRPECKGHPFSETQRYDTGPSLANCQDGKAFAREYSPESKYWLEPGDVLVQRANSLEYVGATAIFERQRHKYIYPDLMMRMRLEHPVLRIFVWRYLNSRLARNYFKSKATGTAGNMPKINAEILRRLSSASPQRGRA